jgi:multiple sugar transport system substrate-binding protein
VTGSCLGGAGIAVSARSAEKEAAVACAFWLASASVQRDLYYWAGGQPANARAWEDQSVNKDCLDFFSATRATIEGASVRPRYPGWMVLQERAGELVHAALSGDIGEDACLDGLDAEREPLIGDGIGG